MALTYPTSELARTLDRMTLAERASLIGRRLTEYGQGEMAAKLGANAEANIYHGWESALAWHAGFMAQATNETRSAPEASDDAPQATYRVTLAFDMQAASDTEAVEAAARASVTLDGLAIGADVVSVEDSDWNEL